MIVIIQNRDTRAEEERTGLYKNHGAVLWWCVWKKTVVRRRQGDM